ncbi:hypothetical protein J4E82_002915 [Alternaria postmessia]|uniref:uncharacterized protein n=1 Tax=Alternaria postmessia TaxID=1187938 RepID=UPI002224D44F|nr:uncharacterized protein J4E82_002915 [Alternaria postmessia]KAI5378222.1 hypothetical protein J4E82_002915 [Alternaria postmessia]
MHVRLFEMVYDHHGYANVAEKMCLECGLRFNKTEDATSYEDRICSFLDSFIREEVASDKWYEMDDLRAVVVVGEVPRAAIAKLENSVQETLKLDHITMLNDIDAALVKSYGAASYALHTEVHPEVYQVFVSPPLELEHSEL